MPRENQAHDAEHRDMSLLSHRSPLESPGELGPTLMPDTILRGLDVSGAGCSLGAQTEGESLQGVL